MTNAKKQSHFMLILVCLLCDVFVRPFHFGIQFNARTSIIGAAIGFCLFAILASFFLKFSAPTNSPFIKFCLLGLFFFTSASTIVKAEQFYRYVSDKQLPAIIFSAVFIGVIIYSAKMPKNALARSAVAVALLSILTVVLILISNFKDISFQRLDINLNSSIVSSAMFHFNFSAEILLFYVLTSKTSEKQSSFTAVIFVVFIIYCVLLILGEAVMGSAAVLQTQMVNTLSKIGSISVFKRLDIFYSAIWILGMLIKSIAFYVYGFNLVAKKSAAMQVFSIAALIALIYAIYSIPFGFVAIAINVISLAIATLILVLSFLKRGQACEKAI